MTLAGKRAMIVEDEFLLALSLEDDLQAAGATVVGPYGTLSATLGAGEILLVKPSDSTVWQTASVSGTSWTLVDAVTHAGGTFTYDARVIDTAGNLGAQASRSVVIDTTAPVQTVAYTQITTDTGASASDYVTSDRTLTVDGTLSATLGAGFEF